MLGINDRGYRFLVRSRPWRIRNFDAIAQALGKANRPYVIDGADKDDWLPAKLCEGSLLSADHSEWDALLSQHGCHGGDDSGIVERDDLLMKYEIDKLLPSLR